MRSAKNQGKGKGWVGKEEGVRNSQNSHKGKNGEDFRVEQLSLVIGSVKLCEAKVSYVAGTETPNSSKTGISGGQ